jgi:Tfp pilus assembly protein PilN
MIGALLSAITPTVVSGQNSYNLFSIIAILVGIAGVAGVVYAVFRSNLATQTITLLKDNNEALQDRVAALESAAIEKDGLIQRQGEQIKDLQNMVTGTTAVVALTEKVDAYQRELIDHLRVVEAAIK